jgi:hypothetical protein
MSMVETANGTSHVFRTLNNTGGITGPGANGVAGHYRHFGSVTDSIYEQARLIASNGRMGLHTPEQIGARWAPTGKDVNNDPGHGNAEWPSAVRGRMKGLHLEKEDASATEIHLHYNAGGIHIHGPGRHELAAHHQRAVEKSKEMMAEATNQNHRAKFA